MGFFCSGRLRDEGVCHAGTLVFKVITARYRNRQYLDLMTQIGSLWQIISFFNRSLDHHVNPKRCWLQTLSRKYCIKCVCYLSCMLRLSVYDMFQGKVQSIVFCDFSHNNLRQP
jgi:hypothetical protein